jgi:hypothetical protein
VEKKRMKESQDSFILCRIKEARKFARKSFNGEK